MNPFKDAPLIIAVTRRAIGFSYGNAEICELLVCNAQSVRVGAKI